MAGIREELKLVDNFSGTFNQFNTAANASIATAEAFKQALDSFSEGFVNGFTEELQRTSAELDEAANGTHRAAQGAEDAAQAQSKRIIAKTKTKNFFKENPSFNFSFYNNSNIIYLFCFSKNKKLKIFVEFYKKRGGNCRI